MHIHFISIGGAVMHNLALALAAKGYSVSGSDDEIREPSRSRLAQYGLLPEVEGWFPEKIGPHLQAIILGMHARADNPELIRAQELGLPIYSFPEYLYEQTKNKKRVVIGGSHGKTTTTAMILHVLKSLGRSFDYMVGSQIDGFEYMVGLSNDSDVAIFEGDEYLTSPIDPRPKFHLYQPHIAVLTGIEWDHMNVFPTFDIYKAQFARFIDLIAPQGHLFYARGDAHLQSVVDAYHGSAHTEAYDVLPYRIEDGLVQVQWAGHSYPMQVFGQHNLQNMHAARMVCAQLGIDDRAFFAAMQQFKGAARRLEKVFENQHTTVFWDFAHAPSKLRATVRAVREMFPDRQLVACMELHTFSSLNKDFLHQYRQSMHPADTAVVYFEKHTLALKRLPNIDPEEVIEAFDRPDLRVIQQSDELRNYLATQSWQGKVLLLMSSGSFGGWDIRSEAPKIVS